MNANTRLAVVAPDLVKLGEALPPAQRKTLACRAAGWACRQTGTAALLDERRVSLLLDAAHSATLAERQELAGDVDRLDEKYFDIVERNDGLDGAGDALQWFSKARAAASLLYALDALSQQSFCDALYEAQAATGDLDGLKALCVGLS